MEEFIEVNNLLDAELLNLCDDIYHYQSGNGDLDKNSYFYNFFKIIQPRYNIDIRFCETLILDLAMQRFENTVKLLMKNRPYWFIKK